MRVFACFLALFLLGFACIALATYPAWLLLHPHFDFPFHRIGERLGMLALLAGFAVAARRLRLADRSSLGYGAPRPVFLREMLIGLIIGVLTMAAIVGIMNALGLLVWGPAAGGAPSLAKLIAARLASGFAVAVIEETFLRGAMHSGIARESGAAAAVLLTSLVYAATHFFASFRIPADRVNPWSGVDLLTGTLHLLVHPLAIADAFACLFAVGVMLGAVRVATGNIAACIGLHAGWVWVMLVVHDLARPLRPAPWSFLLSRFDGFIGWLVFGCTIPLGLGLWRFYGRRYAGGASGASTSSR
jgi:membrane protease YdiL (CAAX protease family)